MRTGSSSGLSAAAQDSLERSAFLYEKSSGRILPRGLTIALNI